MLNYRDSFRLFAFLHGISKVLCKYIVPVLTLTREKQEGESDDHARRKEKTRELDPAECCKSSEHC